MLCLRFSLSAGFICIGCCIWNNMIRYAFCMVFHVRWIFLTTTLRIPPESLAYFKALQAKYTAKLQIMKTMWDGFISQLFSAWGKVRSMREWHIINHYNALFIASNIEYAIYSHYKKLFLTSHLAHTGLEINFFEGQQTFATR